MERKIEYKKLKRKLDCLQNEKEKIKEDKYYGFLETETLNAFIRETTRRIIRLEEIMKEEKYQYLKKYPNIIDKIDNISYLIIDSSVQCQIEINKYIKSKQKLLEFQYSNAEKLEEEKNKVKQETQNEVIKQIGNQILDFERDTKLDKNLIEHFKNDNPKDRFTSISVAGSILGGIELRNLWRENGKLDGEMEEFPYNSEQIEMIDRYHDLEDILEEVELYAEMIVFEDENEWE